jgi:hypothetical protein
VGGTPATRRKCVRSSGSGKEPAADVSRRRRRAGLSVHKAEDAVASSPHVGDEQVHQHADLLLDRAIEDPVVAITHRTAAVDA